MEDCLVFFGFLRLCWRMGFIVVVVVFVFLFAGESGICL